MLHYVSKLFRNSASASRAFMGERHGASCSVLIWKLIASFTQAAARPDCPAAQETMEEASLEPWGMMQAHAKL